MKSKSVLCDEPLLRARQVAVLLKIQLGTVYELVRSGGLPAIRVGRLMRFRRSSIDGWLMKREGARGRGRGA